MKLEIFLDLLNEIKDIEDDNTRLRIRPYMDAEGHVGIEIDKYGAAFKVDPSKYYKSDIYSLKILL